MSRKSYFTRALSMLLVVLMLVGMVGTFPAAAATTIDDITNESVKAVLKAKNFASDAEYIDLSQSDIVGDVDVTELLGIYGNMVRLNVSDTYVSSISNPSSAVTVESNNTFINGKTLKYSGVPVAVGVTDDASTRTVKLGKFLDSIQIVETGKDPYAIPAAVRNAMSLKATVVTSADGSQTVHTYPADGNGMGDADTEITVGDVTTFGNGTYNVTLDVRIGTNATQATANYRFGSTLSGTTSAGDAIPMNITREEYELTIAGAQALTRGSTTTATLKHKNANGQYVAIGNVDDYTFLFCESSSETSSNRYDANNSVEVNNITKTDAYTITFEISAGSNGRSGRMTVFLGHGNEYVKDENLLASQSVTVTDNTPIDAGSLSLVEYHNNTLTTTNTVTETDTDKIIHIQGGSDVSSLNPSTALSGYKDGITTYYMFYCEIKGTSQPLSDSYASLFDADSIKINEAYENDLSAELVTVTAPTGTKALALKVTSKTTDDSEFYATTDGSTGEKTYAIQIKISESVASETTPRVHEIKVDAESLQANAAKAYEIYAFTGSSVGSTNPFNAYTKAQLENFINNDELPEGMYLAGRYEKDGGNGYGYVDGQDVKVVAGDSVYLMAVAYFTDDAVVLSASSIAGWYVNNNISGQVFNSTGDISVTTTGAIKGQLDTSTLAVSSDTKVLEIKTTAYEEDESSAVIAMCPNAGNSNISVDVIVTEPEIVSYIVARSDYTARNGSYTADIAVNADPTLVALNSDPRTDTVAIGSNVSYKLIGVTNNDHVEEIEFNEGLQLNDNFMIGDTNYLSKVTITTATDPSDASKSVNTNVFTVSATTNGGVHDQYAGRSTTVTYTDKNGKKVELQITLGNSEITGFYTVWEDSFGYKYTYDGAMATFGFKQLASTAVFEIPKGDSAKVYTLYSYSNTQFYDVTNPNDWEGYVVKYDASADNIGTVAVNNATYVTVETGATDDEYRTLTGTDTVDSEKITMTVTADATHNASATAVLTKDYHVKVVGMMVASALITNTTGGATTPVDNTLTPEYTISGNQGNQLTYTLAAYYSNGTAASADDLKNVALVIAPDDTNKGVTIDNENGTITLTNKDDTNLEVAYTTTLNGRTEVKYLAEYNAAAGTTYTVADPYVVTVHVDAPAIEGIYLVATAKDSSRVTVGKGNVDKQTYGGTADGTTEEVNAYQYTYGENNEEYYIYPIVIDSSYKLDETLNNTLPEAPISYSKLVNADGSLKSYAHYINKDDISASEINSAITFSTSDLVRSYPSTDADGNVYLDLFTRTYAYTNPDPAITTSATYYKVTLDGSTLTQTLDNTGVTGTIDGLTTNTAEAYVFHVKDPAETYVVDIRAENANATGTDDTSTVTTPIGTAATFNISYGVSDMLNSNVNGIWLDPSVFGAVLPKTKVTVDGVDKEYNETATNALRIEAAEVPSGVDTSLIEYSGHLAEDENDTSTLSITVPTSGTYVFHLWTENRGNAKAPYYGDQYTVITVIAEPTQLTQTVRWGETVKVNIGGIDQSAVAEYICDNVNPHFDTSAIKNGYLRMIRNEDAVVPIRLLDASDHEIAVVNVTTIPATITSASLSDAYNSASNPSNFANGETKSLYWNITYKTTETTPVTYTVAKPLTSFVATENYRNATVASDQYSVTVSGDVSSFIVCKATYTEADTEQYTATQEKSYYVQLNADQEPEASATSFGFSDKADTTNTIIDSINLALNGDDDAELYVWQIGDTVNTKMAATTNTAGNVIYSIGNQNNLNVVVGSTNDEVAAVSLRSDGTSAIVDIAAITEGTATIKVFVPIGSETYTASINVTVSANGTVEPENPTTYTVTVAETTNGSATATPMTAAAGATITITATPDEGYELDTITVNGEAITGTTFTMPAENVTVTVTFKESSTEPEVTYTVSGTVVDEDGDPVVGATVTVGTTATTTDENGAYSVEVPAGDYTVTVSADGYDNATTSVTVTDDAVEVPAITVTVATEPAPTTYTVTVAATTNGTASVDKDTAAEGDTVTVTATPASGYELDAITVTDANGATVTVTNSAFTMPAANVTVTVTFKATTTSGGGAGGGGSIGGGGSVGGGSVGGGTATQTTTEYTVTVATAENGTVTVDKTSAAAGDTVTVTATAADGYKLDTITVTDANGAAVTVTGNTFTMPEANVTVTATFVVKTTAPSASYKDLEQGQWYQDSVDYVIENKIMEGNANEFNPYGDITRAEMVTILYNMEGKPEVTAESTYPDVANDIWYKAAVMWAADAKVADGYGDGTFGPTDTITREQVAVMLYRYAAFKGQDVSARGSLESFADGSEVDSWAQDAMEWAVAAGLINGKDGNMLAPTAEITRVEVAAIIARYCQAK